MNFVVQHKDGDSGCTLWSKEGVSRVLAPMLQLIREKQGAAILFLSGLSEL